MSIGPSYYHREAQPKHPPLNVSFIYSRYLLLLGLNMFVYSEFGGELLDSQLKAKTKYSYY